MDPPSPLPPLLSLPYDIRRQIFVFAGLVRECPITITPVSRPTLYFGTQQLSHGFDFPGCAYPFRKQREPDCVSHGYDPECDCPDLPKQLLCVCRSLHKEAVKLLYGENKFVVRAHHQVEDLDILKTLPVYGIRALRYLLIRLNSWPCARGHSLSNPKRDCCIICPTSAPQSRISASDPELSTGNNLSESIIVRWTEICQRLSGIVIPGTLHLEFICDAQDLDTAQRVVEPMSSLPRLRECSIRLGRSKEYSLRSLAQSTALELTRGVERKKPPTLSFSSLPQEIRLRILWFTNLGPGGTFLKGTHDELETIHVVRGRFAHEIGYRRGLRTCCLDCSFTKLHCSCPLNFASYSASCCCRVLPLELFLVSQQMHVDAVEIFFSTNTFEFRGPFSDTQKMLETLSLRSLKQLRHLVFDMSFSNPYFRDHDQLQWHSLLSFMNKHCNISQLCIAIDLFSDNDAVLESEDEARTIEIIYHGCVALVRAVKTELSTSPTDFHVELGISWDLEPVLEKYIMGPEYDSKNGNRYSKTVYEDVGDDFYRQIPPCHKDL
ncbi:unnamed protein product [Clonostachys byssicola]|uniref:F-box domain-containing protein n=1 Tax=Clonostachys byssicola TaxID=160290 RepID=A0A9N9U8F3_9HYPO|nr:unnamed protein product [Clonostachys byssicola]